MWEVKFIFFPATLGACSLAGKGAIALTKNRSPNIFKDDLRTVEKSTPRRHPPW